jgi:hypothetical protein
VSAPRVLVSGVVLGQPMGGVRRHNAELLPRVARLLAERGGSLAVLEGRERMGASGVRCAPRSLARASSAGRSISCTSPTCRRRAASRRRTR